MWKYLVKGEKEKMMDRMMEEFLEDIGVRAVWRQKPIAREVDS